MRDHISNTADVIAGKVQALNTAVERQAPTEIIATAMDTRDILVDEEEWLRGSVPGLGLEPDAAAALATYRLVVVRAQLLGDRYTMTMDPADVEPWMEALVQLVNVKTSLDNFPA
jgi:hypothetical protein